jgi:hypothetical protein
VQLELTRASVLLRVGAPAEGVQVVLSEGFVSSGGASPSGSTTAAATTSTTGTHEHTEGHESRFHHLCLAPSGMHRMDIEHLRQHSSCLFYGSDDTNIRDD